MNHRSTLAQKDPVRRILRMERHLQTDYSKCKGIVELHCKVCVPVVINEEMMVETEHGCLSLYEVYGEGEGVPGPEAIARELEEIRRYRQMPEDEVPAVFPKVVDTSSFGLNLRRAE